VQGLSGARYYPVPHNDNAGAIRINLAGRDPHGIVSRGQEYDQVCRELAGRLLRIRDASGNKPLVSEVIRIHDQFNGPWLDLMPDLLVVWNRRADVSEITSPDIGRLVNKSDNHRTGDHSRRGLVISSNPFGHDKEMTLDPTQVTPILLEAAKRTA
jgi:predicted AlkP superfamily phosphohydrolase/phosphomutase